LGVIGCVAQLNVRNTIERISELTNLRIDQSDDPPIRESNLQMCDAQTSSAQAATLKQVFAGCLNVAMKEELRTERGKKSFIYIL